MVIRRGLPANSRGGPRWRPGGSRSAITGYKPYSFRTDMDEEGRRIKPGAIQNIMFNHRSSIQVQSFLLIRSHTHVSSNHLQSTMHVWKKKCRV
jgi:hypothetical protein